MTAVITNKEYLSDLARAFGGAILFSFPLLMTMEMWELGFAMERQRLVLFLLLSGPLLFGLSYYAGFRKTYGALDDTLDALAALAVGFAASGLLLALFGVITLRDSLSETIGKLSLQAVPAAIGALLARKQLAIGPGEVERGQEENRRDTYASELFLMGVGSLFLAFNVAPTEEMVLIGYKMANWQALILALGSIVLLHAMVYQLGFAGQHPHESAREAFFKFTLPGYAIALLVALYAQWTFGHTDGHSGAALLTTTVVMAFPGALGAGAARLLV